MGESHTERARADRSCGIVATSAGLPNIRLQRCSPNLVGNGPHSTDAKAPAPVTAFTLCETANQAPSTERDIRLHGWAPPQSRSARRSQPKPQAPASTSAVRNPSAKSPGATTSCKRERSPTAKSPACRESGAMVPRTPSRSLRERRAGADPSHATGEVALQGQRRLGALRARQVAFIPNLHVDGTGNRGRSAASAESERA